MEEMNHASRMLERRTPKPQEQVNCPRCNSTNTKFCYYNNYSLTQPRYFCKTCRRYWTQGGSLRNVPVGGGSRKNKRISSTSTSSSKLDLNPPNNVNQFSQNTSSTANIQIKGQDLNLAFPDQIENNINNVPAMELLRTGIATRGLSSFIPTPMPRQPPPEAPTNMIYSPAVGFGGMHEFKPNQLNLFSIDGHGNNNINRYGAHHNLQLADQDHDNNQNDNNGTNGRFNFFPFGEIKQVDDNNNKGSSQENNINSNNPGGYWTGMLGGGGSW